MQKIVFLTIAVGLAFSAAVFGQTPTPLPSKNPEGLVARAKKYRTRYSESLIISASNLTSNQNKEKDFLMMLEGIERLLKLEKPGPKRNDLLMSRASEEFGLAKYYRLSNLDKVKAKKNEGIYLRRAQNTVAEVVKQHDVDQVALAKAHLILGMSSLFLGDEKQAFDSFVQSVNTNPNGELSARLALYNAEYLFDHERFSEALPWYAKFFPRMSSEEKALALYKTGWCYLLTQQYDKSEQSFLKMVGKKWASEYAIDALRDLAQSCTSHMSEPQLINFGKAQFQAQTNKKLNELYVEFLLDSYYILLGQSGNQDKPLIYAEILRIEKRPEYRVGLAVRRLKAHRQEFAANLPYLDLLEVDKLILESAIKPNTALFNHFGPDLEPEIKVMIQAYGDALVKKGRTPETFTENELAGRLQRVLYFHTSWFPMSPDILQSFKVSLDVCTLLADQACTLRVAHDILRNETLKVIWGKAEVDLLKALEILSLKDPKYKAEFESRVKAFSDTYENDPAWLAYTKRYTVILIAAKKSKEAEGYLKKIYVKEPDLNNLYRWSLVIYQQDRFQEAIDLLNNLPVSGTMVNEMVTILRESHLKLAQGFLAKNDFPGFEKNVKGFLSLCPDIDKYDIANSDYLTQLANQQKWDQVIVELSNLPTTRRLGKTYHNIVLKTVMYFMGEGQYKELAKILTTDYVFGSSSDLDPLVLRFRVVSSGAAVISKKDFDEARMLSNESRSSFLGVMALSEPAWVIQFFEKVPPLTEAERKIWILCYQLRDGRWDADIPKEQMAKLGSALPLELRFSKKMASEQLASYIQFPEVTWSQKRLTKVTPDAIQRVRTVRNQVLRDIKAKPLNVQRRLLNNAIGIEGRMARFFKNAPAPKGVEGEDLAKYKKQLDEVGKEFVDQEIEFKKLLAEIESANASMLANELGPPVDMGLWPKPEISKSAVIEEYLKNKEYSAGLIQVEILSILGKIPPETYYAWRSRIIFSHFKSEVSAKYVFDELNEKKQTALVNTWRQINGPQPASEVQK